MGMGMGCHQTPCRCDKPCTCRWKDEDEDPKWREGCERHDDSEDRRFSGERSEPQEPDDDFTPPPCPVCGSLDACSYDEEGRPLIHSYYDEDSEPALLGDKDA